MEFPEVVAGKQKGWGLQRVYCNAKSQYKSITPAAHGYATALARKRAGRTAFRNTHEGRTTKPNSMVMQYGTNPADIYRAGWSADQGTCYKSYEKVTSHRTAFVAYATLQACIPALFSAGVGDHSQHCHKCSSHQIPAKVFEVICCMICIDCSFKTLSTCVPTRQMPSTNNDAHLELQRHTVACITSMCLVIS